MLWVFLLYLQKKSNKMNIAQFLSEEKLAELKANTEQEAIIRKHIADYEIAKFRATDACMHVMDKLRQLRQEIQTEFGEGVSVNMETGEVILPEAEVVTDAPN